jgi:hypothetical protein
MLYEIRLAINSSKTFLFCLELKLQDKTLIRNQ